MSYPPEHKQRTRERILDAAAALVRERGLEKTGVAEVMDRAGLTVGGFYSHFSSREELLVYAIVRAFEIQNNNFYRALENAKDDAWTRTLVGTYLSAYHRDHPETGCPIAALLSEYPRASQDMRRTIARAYQGWLALLGPRLGGREEAIAMSAMLVGALSLARLGDEKQSKEVLEVCTRMAGRLIGAAPGE